MQPRSDLRRGWARRGRERRQRRRRVDPQPTPTMLLLLPARRRRSDPPANRALDDRREDRGGEGEVRLLGGRWVAHLTGVVRVRVSGGHRGGGARVGSPERGEGRGGGRQREDGPVPEDDAALVVELAERELEETLHLLRAGLRRALAPAEGRRSLGR